jgi:hypothetical protein
MGTPRFARKRALLQEQIRKYPDAVRITSDESPRGCRERTPEQSTVNPKRTSRGSETPNIEGNPSSGSYNVSCTQDVVSRRAVLSTWATRLLAGVCAAMTGPRPAPKAR